MATMMTMFETTIASSRDLTIPTTLIREKNTQMTSNGRPLVVA